jgi:DNA-binding MarR family transcriptional regulator
MENDPEDSALVPHLPCACASLRRAARAVTQLYDQELRGAGQRATQFSLLAVLARRDGITQGQLGELLALDSTTLSRTLRPLEGEGWIESRRGEDRRERQWQLTASGRRQLERGRPFWERAQRRLRDRLGATAFAALLSELPTVTKAARSARHRP